MNDHRNHHSPGPAPDTHELLSAYFDRETTREEAVEIERLLERSPEARQMLDDFAELSDLLHELPRHTLDANFSNRVVQQTKSAPIPADLLTISSTVHSSRWRWRVGLGLTAAAACVVVMVVGPWGRNRGVEVAQRGQPKYSADVAPSPASTSPASTLEDEALRNSGAGDASIALQPADGSVGNSLAMRRGATGETATPSGAGAVAGAFGGTGESAKAKLAGAPAVRSSRIKLSQDFDIRKVAAGDIVEAFRISGDDVSVLRVTVLDVQSSIGKIQLLVTKSMQPDVGPQGVVAEARKLEEADDVQPGEMWALFVQAPPEQMEGILAQIQKEQDIAGVRLEPAIAADSLNEFAPAALAQSRSGLANQRLVANDKETQSRRVKELLAEPKADSVPPAATGKKSPDVAAKSDPSAKIPPAPIAGLGATGKTLNNDSQNSLSRQLAVKVPMDAIEQSNRRNQVSNQADRTAAVASRPIPAQEAKDGPTIANKLVEPSPDDTLQVLIVFQQRPTPASDKARGRKPGSAPPVKKS
jgi:hypothetical protein